MVNVGRIIYAVVEMVVGICNKEKVDDNMYLPDSLRWSGEHIGSLIIADSLIRRFTK